MLRFTILILFSYSATAIAHGGGLDKTGGHHNRKTGEYHCHREPCLSTHQQVQSATKEATRSSYSTLYDRDDWGGWIDE
ncbi:MAG: YHYH domain-containing protein, partial [Gammaproteobacteria bacterium]|nr:YHYH domain-containing protein [Gammaproteobacteria bacterium]